MSIVKGTKEFDKAPTVNGVDVLTGASSVDDLTDVDTTTAAPSVGDKLEWDGSNWVPAAGGAGGDPTADLAEATDVISTTSSSYVLAASMTLTPASGTYLVWFSGVCQHSVHIERLSTAIYSGGTLVSASEREWSGYESQNPPPGYSPFATYAKVTVNGSEAIEGRFKEMDLGTARLRQRQLMILKIA